jgi:hypothetical protein
MYTPPLTLKWCMASESGFNSWNAFPYIRGSYSSKNIAKSRWSVHFRLGRRHPKETAFKQAFSAVFDPQQPLKRDATEQHWHIWPNVYFADALLSESIRIGRAQPQQTVAWPQHADASCSHWTLRPSRPLRNWRRRRRRGSLLSSPHPPWRRLLVVE